MIDQKTLDNMITAQDVFYVLAYFKEWVLWHDDGGFACELFDGHVAHSEYNAPGPRLAVYRAAAKFVKEKI